MSRLDEFDKEDAINLSVHEIKLNENGRISLNVSKNCLY